ncbi:MAG: GNAT family N-acetyltransferase, partial [Anaerolineae bacterium]|nr:GNAT family N-acetyltransferase [Anaerolineae bacterium]
MIEATAYRRMQPDDAPAVSKLVLRTFRTYVAPDYRAEGVETFSRFVQPDVLAERLKAGALGWVALADRTVVGMIEMRSLSHVTLLFVDGAYQRRGISRELLRIALDHCREVNPGLRQVTVNSSPYALEIYRRMGFVPTAPQQEQHGII